MSAWYIAENGHTRGPVSTDNVLAYLKGRDPAQIYVWCEGFEDWQAAKDVPELSKAGPPPATSADQVLSTSVGRGNFIVGHWRGELPLWISYWIVTFVGNVCAVVVTALIAASFASESGYYPLSVFASFTMTWACILVLACWQLVGTWRSAKRYNSTRRQQGKHAFWGGLAQAAVIIGALGLVSKVVQDGVPQIVESWRIALQNDPDIPDYSIRVMRDGTEAEIAGGFKYGLADDFAKILGASPRVQVVHLNSIGGRLGEASKLFELIRSRGLTTYVSSQCLSACTLAFAGGRERYVREGGVLGFHKSAFAGSDKDAFDELQKAVFSRAGFAPGFIAKALSTPNSDIYKPEPSELLAARVITGITDGKQFAISGLRKASKEDVALSLSTALPVFGAMQERFPTSFNTFVEQYHQDVMRGKSEAEVIENARARFIPFVHQLVSLADDDVLIDYAKLLIEQYTTLNQRDPSACYHYVSGAKTTSGSWQTILSEYQARESNIQERVIRTALRRPTIDRRTRETLWSKVWTGVRARGVTDSDLQIIGAQTVDKSKHALYCTVNIAMFREIARLQQREAAMLMRMIFEED